jgi:hypothetical protein
VLIESLAQVLSPAIGPQDFNCPAVVLCNSPCLEHFVGLKSLVFGAQQESGRIPGRVVSEGDEIPSILAGSDGGWPPNIGMYLISKVLSGWSNPDFRNGQTSGAREDAGVTVCFMGAWVQFDPYDGTAGDELPSTLDCDMAQSTVQLHN